MCWLAFSAASHQQAGTTSNLGCSSSARSAAIFRERPLILFGVSTAENLSTKSLIDQYSSGIRAGGVGQIAHCNLLSEHFSRRERPADDLSSWSQCCWVMGHALNGCRTINTRHLYCLIFGHFVTPVVIFEVSDVSPKPHFVGWCSKPAFYSGVVLPGGCCLSVITSDWSVVGTFPVNVQAILEEKAVKTQSFWLLIDVVVDFIHTVIYRLQTFPVPWMFFLTLLLYFGHTSLLTHSYRQPNLPFYHTSSFCIVDPSA